MSRPRVVLLRGHNANPWDLRPWELLRDDFDVSVLVTGSNRYDLEDLDLPVVRVRALRDRLPRGRAGELASRLPGDRYLDLERHLAGADIVHSAELGVWFSGQPAALKERLGFRLVLTVWETIPFRDTFRAFRGRALPPRRARASRPLPRRDRARARLPAAGGRRREPDRGLVPGRRRRAVPRARGAAAGAEHVIVSPGRLVWEKGHYDVLRALARVGRLGAAAARRRRARARAPAPVRGRSRARAGGSRSARCPTREMPSVFASASCVVLGSLSIPLWEEQFGMVLAEALAAGAPMLASTSGAIPEVLGGAARSSSRPATGSSSRACSRRAARAAAGRARRARSASSSALLARGRGRRGCARPTSACSRLGAWPTRAAASTAASCGSLLDDGCSSATCPCSSRCGGSADRDALAAAGFTDVTITNVDDAGDDGVARAVRLGAPGRRGADLRGRLVRRRARQRGPAPLPLAATGRCSSCTASRGSPPSRSRAATAR